VYIRKQFWRAVMKLTSICTCLLAKFAVPCHWLSHSVLYMSLRQSTLGTCNIEVHSASWVQLIGSCLRNQDYGSRGSAALRTRYPFVRKS
jgi:hypothetical protein